MPSGRKAPGLGNHKENNMTDRSKDHSHQDDGAPSFSEEELFRAHFYALLSRLLGAPLDADFLKTLATFKGDDSEMGTALRALGEKAKAVSLDDAVDEYTRLFYGHGAGGEMIPYASYYLTGFVYEKPLSQLRDTLNELGIAQVEGVGEPEDHISFVLEIMHGLISGDLGGQRDLIQQKKFFNDHVAPWASRFFEDLEQAENADLYRPVGTIGRILLAVEVEAFDMAA